MIRHVAARQRQLARAATFAANSAADVGSRNPGIFSPFSTWQGLLLPRVRNPALPLLQPLPSLPQPTVLARSRKSPSLSSTLSSSSPLLSPLSHQPRVTEGMWMGMRSTDAGSHFPVSLSSSTSLPARSMSADSAPTPSTSAAYTSAASTSASLSPAPSTSAAASAGAAEPSGQGIRSGVTRVKTKALTKQAKHIMNILDAEATQQLRQQRSMPAFKPGDVLSMKIEVPENKRRTSIVKGIVIARRNAGISSTFRIRRMLAGVGVEMVFPLYSPNIKEITVIGTRKVRRAKLYYLRDKVARMSAV